MSINKKIHALIKANAKSQTQIAKEIGTTQQYLSRLMKSNDITLSQIEKICKALNMPVYALFQPQEKLHDDDLINKIKIIENHLFDIKQHLVYNYEFEKMFK